MLLTDSICPVEPAGASSHMPMMGIPDSVSLRDICLGGQTLGVVVDRLYLVNRVTGTASEDLLAQVRDYPGFNHDRISTFHFRPGENPDDLYFSCALGNTKTGAFTVSPVMGKVVLFVQS